MNTGQRPEKQRQLEGVSEKTAGLRPALRQSPRGGMLYAGGVPGNRGGTGRPITHGRYSQIHRETLRRLIAQHEADPDPLNMLPELAMCRALFVDFINRFDTFTEALLAWHAGHNDHGTPPKPTQALDISDAWRLLSETTKIVKRIEDIRGRNAITRKDFMRLMREMARAVVAVVDRYVDPEVASQVKNEIDRQWLEIRLT
jgi:hypothetical protein